MRTLLGHSAEVFYAMRKKCCYATSHVVWLLPELPHSRVMCDHPGNQTNGDDNCKPHNCPLTMALTVEVTAAGLRA